MKRALTAITLLLLALGPALAQEAARPAPGPRLHLSGKATLESAPDFALISVGVGAKAPTAAAALDQTSAAAGRIVAAARHFGIAPRDIQTSQVSLEPAFKPVRDPSSGAVEQRPDGYQATNSVAVRVRELGQLGEFLRQVVDGGANRIGGIAFELADPGKLEREALAAAVKDALRQAEVIAEAAGVKLGPIQEIRHGGRSDRPAPMRGYARGATAAARAPVPVEAGALEVSAEVDLVISLRQP
jgi:uncharacterized protein YggE